MKSKAEVTDAFEIHRAENGSGTVDPDSPAESARPHGQRAAYAAPGFVATFADKADPTIAWPKGFGLCFDFLPPHVPTKSPSRLLPAGGALALMERLAARGEALDVEVLNDS